MSLKELSGGIRDLKEWMRKNPRPKPLTRDRVCGGLNVVVYNGKTFTGLTINKVSIVGKRPNITLVEGTVLWYQKSCQGWALYDGDGHFKAMYYLYPNRDAAELGKLYDRIDKALIQQCASMYDLINSLPHEPA